MTRSWLRWAVVVAAVVAVGGGVSGQVRPPAGKGMVDPQPDFDTLRRLAQQLGTGQSGPIDPEMLKFAQEFLKNNPDFLKNPDVQRLQNDPTTQQRIEAMRQQLQGNPQFVEQLKEQFKQQQSGPGGITPEQLQQFKERFQPRPGGEPFGGPQPQPPGTPPRPGPVQPPPTPPQMGNGGPGEIPRPMQQPQQPQQPPPQFRFDPRTGGIEQQMPAAQNKDYNNVVNFWEANVGSMDNTPALRQSLLEMFSGTGASPLDGLGNSPLGDALKGAGQGQGKPWYENLGNGQGGNNSGFGDWLKNMSSNGGPSWWKGLTGGTGKSWWSGGGGGGGSGFTPPNTSGFGSAPSLGGLGGISGVGISGLGTVGTVLVVLLVLAVVGFLVYRYWPQIQAMRDGPKPLAGLGKWPIDPRQVTDRESLVKVFEYFSVFLCGDGARVWNHVTIAEAFRENVPASAPFADQLARLYAVARYTPAKEEIAAADIAAARRYLCLLAGVQEG
jgi:hypothetical protein